MKNAVYDTFGRKRHLPCYVHSLNLVVTTAIASVEGLKNLVDKVKNIVSFFKHSIAAADELRKVQLLDGKTRGRY